MLSAPGVASNKVVELEPVLVEVIAVVGGFVEVEDAEDLNEVGVALVFSDSVVVTKKLYVFATGPQPTSVYVMSAAKTSKLA